MWKTAGAVLAAILIFLLPVSRAAPPDEEPVAAVEPAAAAAGPAVPAEAALPEPGLPAEGDELTPEELVEVYGYYLERAQTPQRWQTFQLPPLRPSRPGGTCLAAGGEGENLCAAAVRISHSRPCLAAGDCPALEDWKEVMGKPGLRPAPRSMVRAADRTPSEPPPPPEQD